MLFRIRTQFVVTFEKLFSLTESPCPAPAGVLGEPLADFSVTAKRVDGRLYCAAADDAAAGRFSIFAMKDCQLAFPPDWNRDPKTGTHAPLDFGKTLDYRREDLVGDIKYLWEINRHLELVTLAQAYACTSNSKYLAHIRIMIDSWIEQCPYPRGPNWTSSLELSVRLVNWALAWQLVGGDSSDLFAGEEGASFRLRWLEAIYRHLSFIRGHLSKYSSANNHLLGEYMGLYIGSVTWPLWKQCHAWMEFAAAGFEHEALLQNAPDGVNREQGIWYHHEVADMMLLCGLTGRAAGYEFSQDYWHRLESMLTFVSSMMDVAGNLPMFGDSDDALMVRFYPGKLNVYRSLLATGAVLFKRHDFKRKAGHFDDKSRWLLGLEGEKGFNDLPEHDPRDRPTRRQFKEGGYWIFGSSLDEPDEVRMTADAGPLGYLTIAAHGHADALSFTLSVAGNEILIDPGTFAYHTQKKWRDYFRGTSAHNTIRIDGRDQSEPGGNFLWLKHAAAAPLHYQESDQGVLWVAEHDGYTRLPDPVIHRRSIELDKLGGRISVIDALECRNEHKFEVFWHLAEHSQVCAAESGVVVTTGEVSVSISMPQKGFRLDLVSGQVDPPLGWISRSFDKKLPTSTLRWQGYINGPTELRTIILVDRGRGTGA